MGTTLRCALAALKSASSLVVLIFGAVAFRAIGDADMKLIDRVEMPSLEWHLQGYNFSHINVALPRAALLAFLVLGGHLLVAERVRQPADHLDSRRELIALGACNFASALGGGMPPMPNL